MDNAEDIDFFDKRLTAVYNIIISRDLTAVITLVNVAKRGISIATQRKGSCENVREIALRYT